MLKSSLIPFILTVVLMLITVSGSNRKKVEEINNKYSASDQILVAAHRGSHSKFPENSLAAIEESIQQGIDIVEVDIRETKDNIPVLMHDKSLDRTTTGDKLLIDLIIDKSNNIFTILSCEIIFSVFMV